MAKDIIADGMKEQNHCDTCLNQHTDKCNHCMVTEYHGQRVSNPTGYEQEPCETSTDEPMTMVYPTIFCDDAISREAVLRVIDGWYEQNRDTENIEDLIILITYMGSVQPSRKGHWIRWREDFEYIERGVTESVPHCQCSECKKEYDPHTAQFINFCPNCGADMRGDTE